LLFSAVNKYKKTAIIQVLLKSFREIPLGGTHFELDGQIIVNSRKIVVYDFFKNHKRRRECFAD